MSICLKQNVVKSRKLSTHSAHSDNCYSHFFFYWLSHWVSSNCSSNRCWKFQLSILKNKILKKIIFKLLSISKQKKALFTVKVLHQMSIIFIPNDRYFTQNHFANLFNLTKRSHSNDYCLRLTQDSQSESGDSVKFTEKTDHSITWQGTQPDFNAE